MESLVSKTWSCQKHRCSHWVEWFLIVQRLVSARVKQT